ncbi:hypothetical protein WA026_013450 [Henosepilachna vigintioctopunctata]|uniref:Proton-coupled folate transporter n=1 Tax=Henosepilachna vigintioctopunctata TaxID=420089 RepID=A0AAW1V609_9CUCU
MTSIPKSSSMDLNSNNNLPNEMNTLQRIKYIITHITVEPLIFFYILPGTMGVLATQNMNLEKACRVNLQYNSTICDAMVRRDHSGYEDYQEEEVHQLVAKMLIIKTAIVGFVPTCLLLFFGSWSDRHGRRKPVILFPVFGDIISYLCLFLCAYFFLELSVQYSTFADALPYSLGGGPPCIALGIYSYISERSSEKDRTIRVGTVSMFQNIAIAIGNAIAGFLIKPLGYEGVYATSTLIMSCIFIYGLIIIKDTNIIKVQKTQNCLGDFFYFGHIKNTFNICFKDGPNNRKWKMMIMMLISLTIMGPFYGEIAVLYLYTRIKFEWDETNFSIYNTLQFVIQICGSTFALSYFTKYLKLNDALLGVIAMISKTTACLMYAFAPTGSYFLCGVFAEIFHGTSHIAMRSIISKIVPPNELGQATSVFGVCEAVMPLLFGPFYSTLYNYTLRSFPGTFYLVSAGTYLIAMMLYYWLYRTDKIEEELRDRKAKQQMENLLNRQCT